MSPEKFKVGMLVKHMMAEDIIFEIIEVRNTDNNKTVRMKSKEGTIYDISTRNLIPVNPTKKILKIKLWHTQQ